MWGKICKNISWHCTKKGHLAKGDVPCIVVTTDASYPKRAMGNNYNSLACCAAVFGHETKEIIDLVLRTKSSVEKYGLIYNVLIADSDSSVYKGILNANPYKDYDIRV